MFGWHAIIHINNSWVERWLYKGHGRKAPYIVLSDWVMFKIFQFKIINKKGIQKYSLRMFPNVTKFLVPMKFTISTMKVDRLNDWFYFFHNTYTN